MKDTVKLLAEKGLNIPKLLLPTEGTDLQKWAVVACDQYTSQRDYWKRVKDFTEGYPTTLNLIFPEAYLEDPNPEERISSIHKSMREYLDKGVLKETEPQFILVKRSFSRGKNPRWGLVAALDLEHYNYHRDSTTLIRATEGTIVERIPPRKRIRLNAPIELPHILVLIDDPFKGVLEPLIAKSGTLPVAYDFDLMMDSGHITGYRIADPSLLTSILEGLTRIADKERFEKTYGNPNPLLYALGDGNHSLATAKAVWEEIKNTNKDKNLIENHPARYALVEIENIYDPGIEFEPIYRVLFSLSEEKLFQTFAEDGNWRIEKRNSLEETLKDLEKGGKGHTLGFASSKGYGLLICDKPETTLPVGSLQSFLDRYLKQNPETLIDYIHGIEPTHTLGTKPGNIGFFLPGIEKKDFFRTVIQDGAFPRKTFSMGEAYEKRFYIEGRRIL